MKFLPAVLVLAWLSSASAQPKAVVPLLDVKSGYLLGASQGGKWLKPKPAALAMKGGATLRSFSATRSMGTVRATQPQSTGAPCPDTLFSAVSPKSLQAEFALGGTHNPLPRPLRIENPNQTIYRSVVATVLKSRGIAKPVVQVRQIWRVDLDGDGTQEVLICATRKLDSGAPGGIAPASRAGDYSLVLLRKIVSGQVRDILIEGQFHRKRGEFDAPGFYQLGAVFDADGDGRMEILVRGAYYEGEWTGLYSLQGVKPREVLVEGCGA